MLTVNDGPCSRMSWGVQPRHCVRPEAARTSQVKPHGAGMVPSTARQPWDMRGVLARILDGSRFDEFKKLYGSTLITGFGAICGQTVGIVANEGILFSGSALKGIRGPSCQPMPTQSHAGDAGPVCLPSGRQVKPLL